MTFDEALAHCGMIAILRGITPAECVAVGEILHAAGFRIVEVPLNSPDPFESIRLLSDKFAGRLIIGAGTVLHPTDVDHLSIAQGSIAVAPNCNPAVIGRALELGIVPVPGVFTPTEAFAAIAAGARNLKLFPVEAASPAVLRAWRAVVPNDIRLFGVGGITTENMTDWLAAGATGFGIGSSLYRPGMTRGNIADSAGQLMSAWKEAVRR